MSNSVPPGRLLSWFDHHERDLPWRRPGMTGWHILVSEVMSQQTPVARVAPRWEQWLARWPVPSALAAESPATVLRAWDRLGYPRRALRLHACAGVIAREHDDVVPEDVEVLLGLPGIGDYTARAVACFAYDQPVAVVDTNVRRVIARAVHGRELAGNPSRSELVDAEALLPRRPDGEFAESAPRFAAAIMELGALVCTARKPRCDDCPLLATCRWVARGRPAHEGPRPRVQKFAGTDRQVRGLLMAVLRDSATPVTKSRLDAVWQDSAQRERALDSLLGDGLADVDAAGRFHLPGAR